MTENLEREIFVVEGNFKLENIPVRLITSLDYLRLQATIKDKKIGCSKHVIYCCEHCAFNCNQYFLKNGKAEIGILKNNGNKIPFIELISDKGNMQALEKEVFAKN